MTNQNHNAQVASKPFALICSYRVPTTELNLDFTPSVSVVIGHYDSQEQAKQARQAIQHTALISAWLYHSFESNASDKARHSAAQAADNTIAATATLNADTSKKDKGHDAQTSQPLNINTYTTGN